MGEGGRFVVWDCVLFVCALLQSTRFALLVHRVKLSLAGKPHLQKLKQEQERERQARAEERQRAQAAAREQERRRALEERRREMAEQVRRIAGCLLGRMPPCNVVVLC